ncbi:hypothetical protein SAMN05444320_11722 [Streptoalloteichus hindustanus]|uniref:HTH arsR-type domain-containing protein n=1 Tax=Streptoalloteichus hindustanus TaxID=2017 RepID=A0A1M5NZX3_STRHI|nr:hypothetical protein SAMN05444320_11722 [Streptoalloteichus hindustanus]
MTEGRGCGLVVADHEGRQVRYALADAHLTRALGELVQVVLAVDTGQPCVDDDRRTTIGGEVGPAGPRRQRGRRHERPG